MSNNLTLTRRLTNEGWVITGSVNPSSNMPRDIFVYENTGEPTLGEFHSVVTVYDMHRVPVWQGSAIPLSKSRYVRAATLVVPVPPEEDVLLVESTLVSSAKDFLRQFTSSSEATTSYVLD